MAKQTPLEMLINNQKEKVDEALNMVAICQQTLNQAIDQRDMLYQYRIDYERQFREDAKQGIKPTHLHNYHAFLSKLDHAIEQQERIVVQLEKQLEKKKEEWVEAKNQLRAYETLQERKEKEKQVKENRKEQQLSDEHGARKHQERLQREQEEK